MTSAWFIALEGLDGSGKSSHAQTIVDQLTASGISALLTHEPTYTSTAARKIKEVLTGRYALDPLELQKLYIEDRIWHLEEIVEPALTSGTTVVSDRYWLSTIAYGSLSGLEEILIGLHEDMRKPDITIIYDTEPAECLARIARRGETPELFDKLEKMKKIQATYRELAATMPAIYVIDNNRPFDEAARDTLALLRKQGIAIGT